MNLYQINEEIMSCIDLETGEILDVDKLSELKIARDEKIENIGLWIKNLTAEAEALRAEKRAFDERLKTTERKIASLKGYLTGFLQGEKFETAKLKIGFRKSESLEVSEDGFIPQEYFRTKKEVNIEKLKKDIKAGLEIKGVYLVEKQNINIK